MEYLYYINGIIYFEIIRKSVIYNRDLVWQETEVHFSLPICTKHFLTTLDYSEHLNNT